MEAAWFIGLCILCAGWAIVNEIRRQKPGNIDPNIYVPPSNSSAPNAFSWIPITVVGLIILVFMVIYALQMPEKVPPR